MASTLTTIWTALVILLGLAESRHVWKRYRINPPAPRWLLALLPIAAAAMLVMAWIRVVHSPFEDWNGARIAPAVAWAMGMPLYFDRGVGPATDFIYGPVGAILRLPAALAGTPTMAVIIAAVINVMMMWLPVACLTLTLTRSALNRTLALLACLGFSLTTPSLVYSTYHVHSDAPAVGFALLGCVALLRLARSPRPLLWLVGCALFGVLSVFAKQNMGLILLVFPIYAWRRFGWKYAAILLGLEILFAALAAGLSVYAFGFGPLRYSTFTAAVRPRRWSRYGWSFNLFLASGNMIQDLIAPATALGIAVLTSSAMRTQQSSCQSLRQPWVLPLLVALAMFPGSLLGYARVGGELNSFTLTSYFLAASLSAMIASHRYRRGKAASRVFFANAACLCVALAVLGMTPWSMFLQWRNDITSLAQNPQQTAFEFSLQHPNAAYFPWQPLATLMADKKYYLFEYGIVGLRASGEPTSPQRVLPYVPEQMDYLIYRRQPQSDDLRRMFPRFDRERSMTGMDDWTIWTRGDQPN